MVLLVKLVAIVTIVYGCVLVLRPDTLKKVYEYIKEGDRFGIGCGIKIVIGILLMIASSSCETPWVVLLFGALATFGASLALIVKRETQEQFIEWALNRSKKEVYMFGIIAGAIGALLAISA